ncbi:hypothetical protein WR25_18195 [Diploscapter pachys]|uniref:Translocon-associated protein subunit alpha n=1 Tax=Diploscapter pachys TaxID=2018661 RepID=A0A2A2JI76_9BILA|nr:hypothetical protein WR25_18195 [Diploscapter pachys]
MKATRVLCLIGFLLVASGIRAEDPIDGEVTDDAGDVKAAAAGSASATEDDELTIGASPDATLAFVFTMPANANHQREFPANRPVRYLIGFQNRGEKDFIIKSSETSFRYPMDFNYHIQNFTQGQYNRRVAPKEEVTVDYSFFTHESFAGRPLGLVVNLHYEDAEGRLYVNNVFNETITILEDDSSFSTETGFLYLVFAGFIVLALFAVQHFLNKLSRKTGLQKKRQPQTETGTTSGAEVDFEWIPREVLKQNEKSPKPSSPKPRKAKKVD